MALDTMLILGIPMSIYKRVCIKPNTKAEFSFTKNNNSN